MGIVSIIAVAAGIGFLFALRRKINEIAEEEKDDRLAWVYTWGARLSGLIAVLGIIGIVDSYIYELPNPLERDGIELPDKPTNVEPVEDVEIKPASKPDPMKEAQEDHQGAMDDFEKRAKARHSGPEAE